MSALSHLDPAHAETKVSIRRIDARGPSRWLEAGWQDIRFNPLPSLAYGLLFGLVVLMPMLGHASWHAYRELVE